MPHIANIPIIFDGWKLSTGVGKKILAKKGGFITSKLPMKAEKQMKTSRVWRRSWLKSAPKRRETMGVK